MEALPVEEASLLEQFGLPTTSILFVDEERFVVDQLSDENEWHRRKPPGSEDAGGHSKR